MRSSPPNSAAPSRTNPKWPGSPVASPQAASARWLRASVPTTTMATAPAQLRQGRGKNTNAESTAAFTGTVPGCWGAQFSHSLSPPAVICSTQDRNRAEGDCGLGEQQIRLVPAQFGQQPQDFHVQPHQ